MGYNTRYRVTASTPLAADEFIGVLSATADYSRDAFVGHEPVKWYEHDRDIARLMFANGMTAVDLHGEGEEQGDVWDKEYRLSDGRIEITEYRYTLRRPDAHTKRWTLT